MRLTDQDLERLAPRLGARAEARLDVDRVAALVTARLANAGGAERRRPVWRWLAAAAGVLLVAGAGFLTFGTDGTAPRVGHPVGLTPSLLDLSATELRTVLDSLDQPAPMLVSSEPTIDDLDTEQLEALLTLMEG